MITEGHKARPGLQAKRMRMRISAFRAREGGGLLVWPPCVAVLS
jgi:hypothetical protein